MMMHFIGFSIAGSWIEYRRDQTGFQTRKKYILDYLDFREKVEEWLIHDDGQEKLLMLFLHNISTHERLFLFHLISYEEKMSAISKNFFHMSKEQMLLTRMFMQLWQN